MVAGNCKKKKADNGGFDMSKKVMKNMEFLMKELHKEWERSGITKATVIIQQEEVEAVNQVLIKKIAVQQEGLENDTMTFAQSIRFSKESYVLLRMIKKIKAKEDKMNSKSEGNELYVPMDKDELALYKTMFVPKLKK